MQTRWREVTLTLAWKEWQTAKNWGFYIRGSDRKYAYHITTDPPSFFHSCVSFLGQNRAGALQKASKRLQSSQLGRSQHALHISSKKTAKKTMHGELLKKNKKTKPDRKLQTFVWKTNCWLTHWGFNVRARNLHRVEIKPWPSWPKLDNHSTPFPGKVEICQS